MPIKADVTATFTEPLLGSSPLSKDIYSKYIESLQVKRVDALQEGDADEQKTVPEVDTEKGVTGFHRDGVGLFVYDYAVKGFFKEAGNILKDKLGEKNLRSKLDNYLFVFPRRVYLLDSDSKPIGMPHGVLERPLRAQTMQGPRVTLAKSEMLNAGTKIAFRVELIDGHPLKHPERIIEAILDYSKYKFLGQWRNGSYGRATYELKFVS